MVRNRMLLWMQIVAICAGLGTTAQAQAVDPEALVAGLAPGAAGPMVTTLRAQNALTIQPQTQIPSAFDFPSVNVSVDFQDNSHLLTAEGMIALRSVALALNDDRLRNEVFQVAGHSVLSSDPNSAIRVSTLRAKTVAEHLTAYYGVSPQRLVSVGYGASTPADPGAINSPLNTRIQFINILSQ